MSRKGTIIAAAEQKAYGLAARFPEQSKARANVEGLVQICRAFLLRKVPVLPTAGLVSEQGGNTNANFPSERTIYNSYRRDLAIWRKAYHDIMNIDAEMSLQPKDVERIDASLMDPAAGNIINQLKAIILELTQRINVLKHLHDLTAPIATSSVLAQTDADRMMSTLHVWLKGIGQNPFFEMDGIGIRVSRKTPVGALVMRREIFDELLAFAEDYSRIRNAQKIRDASG